MMIWLCVLWKGQLHHKGLCLLTTVCSIGLIYLCIRTMKVNMWVERVLSCEEKFSEILVIQDTSGYFNEN